MKGTSALRSFMARGREAYGFLLRVVAVADYELTASGDLLKLSRKQKAATSLTHGAVHSCPYVTQGGDALGY